MLTNKFENFAIKMFISRDLNYSFNIYGLMEEEKGKNSHKMGNDKTPNGSENTQDDTTHATNEDLEGKWMGIFFY